jgi:hypothetical protein
VSIDGRALRQHWDTTCDGAADVVRRHIPLAQERGDTDVASYLRAAPWAAWSAGGCAP